ncbi:MAG: response regulator transcription factor [Micropruina sp.]|uniref:response regulator transcription factor n=1 Tax=Micropruina sp. TaxID=2737536 RepID=UPI0039E666A8
MDHPRDDSDHSAELIRVIVVDDDRVIRAMLTDELGSAAGISLQGSYESGLDAVAALDVDRPHVALVDIAMPALDGPETTRRLRAASPQTQVLALTSLTDRHAASAMLNAGALGFLPKDLAPQAIVHAVRTARHGIAVLAGAGAGLVDRTRKPDLAGMLSPTERQILLLIREGRTTHQICREVYLSPSTVKYHVTALMEKLGATNRVTLAIRAVELGIC